MKLLLMWLWNCSAAFTDEFDALLFHIANSTTPQLSPTNLAHSADRPHVNFPNRLRCFDCLHPIHRSAFHLYTDVRRFHHLHPGYRATFYIHADVRRPVSAVNSRNRSTLSLHALEFQQHIGPSCLQIGRIQRHGNLYKRRRMREDVQGGGEGAQSGQAIDSRNWSTVFSFLSLGLRWRIGPSQL
ncbi:hypothetical protein BU26DRAFT_135774 [Trematosphaeria pertusa]|uniref:Secreted protein n=1 Tax=Trematosphaeria pertusa TaxID=390896 RepID=A0A6A6IUP6_9PLEO|nr:uncharacterized protein BU26DRAFT_135774 [Trematosphaeria pertusa]KAF2254281.1 hypothetical protein BU26DRAFT_135774 [Trematosphaeria pertusa]